MSVICRYVSHLQIWSFDMELSLIYEFSSLATSSPWPVFFTSAPALPSLNNDGVIIQKGVSFYEFSCDIDECSWTTKPQQLIEGRWEDAIAMYLPSDFPC